MDEENEVKALSKQTINDLQTLNSTTHKEGQTDGGGMTIQFNMEGFLKGLFGNKEKDKEKEDEKQKKISTIWIIGVILIAVVVIAVLIKKK